MRGAVLIVVYLGLNLPVLQAQEQSRLWSLKTCIDYALEQNIQVKKAKVSLEESQANTRQAAAQLFPSLSFSTSHDLVNRPEAGTNLSTDKNSYSGSYGFTSAVSLYQGGKLRLNIRQQEVEDKIQELYIRQAENNIQVSVTESFLQVLYAAETVEINRNAVEVSAAQCERARQLVEAGSLSGSDLAQLMSQYATDKYQLVAAQSALDERRLELKQLLELDITEEIRLEKPHLTEEDVIKMLPDKETAYAAALDFMPEIESSRLSIESADNDVAIARSGYLPEVQLTAGIGTSHISGTGNSFVHQVKNNFNESIGLSLSVPLYSRRQNKTAVKIAQLQTENAELNYQDARKEILKIVETVYLDALSCQDRYKAARESVRAAQESFGLVQEQFKLGMKNTVELLTEKNTWLSAQQELLQAKYRAVLSCRLLNFYQGKGIEL